MGGKSRGRVSSKQVFTWLMILALVAMILPERITKHLDHGLAVLWGPLSKTTRNISLAATDRLRQPTTPSVSPEQYRQLQQEYQQSVTQLVNLQQELKNLRQLNQQWSGLRQELGLAKAQLIVAEVVGHDSSTLPQIVYLDRGARDQVQPGQMVLALASNDQLGPDDSSDENIYRKCVVGKIKEVSLTTSTMQLLTDGKFSLPVFIEPKFDRTQAWRANGVLSNSPLGEIQVTLVSVENPVQPGDVVLACSDPRSLPVEMITGWVASCIRDRNSPVFWQIKVAPAADLYSLGEVVIVKTGAN